MFRQISLLGGKYSEIGQYYSKKYLFLPIFFEIVGEGIVVVCLKSRFSWMRGMLFVLF